MKLNVETHDETEATDDQFILFSISCATRVITTTCEAVDCLDDEETL